MRNKVIGLFLATMILLGVLPVSVFAQETQNERRYELPFYETYIKVSNVTSDNGSEYIQTRQIETDEGMIEHQFVSDLYVEATAPCKVTYGFGDQYINYAERLEDGSYDSDYSKRIPFDVYRHTFYTYDENHEIQFGDTVDTVTNDSPMNAGAENNYVTLGEGVYIVSNYHPSLRGAGGQCFSDYNVILTVKSKDTITAVPTASNVLVDNRATAFEAYNISGNNYFKLRDLAMALNGTDKQFEVTWNASEQAILLLSQKAYTAVGGEMQINASPVEQNAVHSAATIFLDGNAVSFTAYTIGGYTYFKLRDIAKLLNIGVNWDPTSGTIGIQTTATYTE